MLVVRLLLRIALLGHIKRVGLAYKLQQVVYKEGHLVIPAHECTAVSGNNNFWTKGRVKAIFHSGSESSTLFSLLGAKVRGDESSTHGTFAPRSESTWERKFQLPASTNPLP